MTASFDPARRTALVATLAWPLGAAAGRPRSAMPALLLAETAPADLDPAGWLVSEKLDGVRALWDGERLRFRSGLAVAAPAGFLARLPPVTLDGELWLGRGRFEALSGLVRRTTPDEAAWREVRYMLFEQPGAGGPFAERALALHRLARDASWPQLQAVEQARVADAAALQRRLDAIVRDGGEGLMLHRADAPYVTGRSPLLLKLKPLRDAEAVVVGHVAGQGRHAGRLGALRVRAESGQVFLLGTGFSDAQREAPPPRGTLVTYTYRGTTAQGLPRFASFLRMRGP